MLDRQFISYRSPPRLFQKWVETLIKLLSKLAFLSARDEVITAKKTFAQHKEVFLSKLCLKGARCMFISSGPLKDDLFAVGNQS